MSKIEEIESFVRLRSNARARRAITSLLRGSHAREEMLIQACDWYRRLGLYREGFRLVVPEPPLPARVSTREPLGRRLLWAARFLNLLGSPELALPLLSHLDLESEEDHWIAGNIHLVNFEPAKAFEHFTRMVSLAADPDSYQARLRSLGLADALSGLARFDEAEAIARETVRRSTEPLLLGIAHQAAGEYAARSGEIGRALAFLERAKSFFPEGDRSADTAFLQKWLGFAQARSGQRASGLAALAASERRLRRLRLRPEAWLDVYRLRAELGELDPKEIARLVHFPGLSEGFRRTLPALPHAHRFGAEEAHLHVDLAREEYRQGNHLYAGLPKEIQILAWVRITEAWGLDVLKAKSLLWPGEPHAFLQLDGRLAQLLHRLRHAYGMKLSVTNGVIRLGSRERTRVSVLVGGDARPSLLRERRAFPASAVGNHYHLSKTQSAERLALWERRGWVRRVGAGPAARYISSKR